MDCSGRQAGALSGRIQLGERVEASLRGDAFVAEPGSTNQSVRQKTRRGRRAYPLATGRRHYFCGRATESFRLESYAEFARRGFVGKANPEQLVGAGILEILQRLTAQLDFARRFRRVDEDDRRRVTHTFNSQ